MGDYIELIKKIDFSYYRLGSPHHYGPETLYCNIILLLHVYLSWANQVPVFLGSSSSSRRSKEEAFV